MKKFLIFLFIIIFNIPIFAQISGDWQFYPKYKIDETSDGEGYFLQNVTKIIEYNNTLYFANWESGIDILNPDLTWSRLDHRNTPLKNNTIIYSMDIKNDIITVATDVGLLIITANDTLLFTVKDTINNTAIAASRISNSIIDNDNNIWFTYKNITRFTKYDHNKFQHYLPPSSYYPYPYSDILYCDNDNNIWYRSSYTLTKFNGTDYEHWDSTNSPLTKRPGFRFWALYHNRAKDQFFISTAPTGMPPSHEGNGILWLFDIKSEIWTEINTDNMPVNRSFDSVAIDDITTDNNGNIFLGIFNPHLNIQTPRDSIFVLSPSGQWSVLKFPFHDLVPLPFITYRSFLVDSKNNIWIGTLQDGVIRGDLNKLLSVKETSENSGLPDIWIRYVRPNPIANSAKLELFIEPSFYSDIQVKIYNYLGIEIKDITEDLLYDPESATGTIDFSLDNNIPAGIYFINAKSNTESRTISIFKYN